MSKTRKSLSGSRRPIEPFEISEEDLEPIRRPLNDRLVAAYKPEEPSDEDLDAFSCLLNDNDHLEN